ncbi:MAG TPA: OsmC family protein [Micromonosporaceae bacterium]
MAHEHSYRVAVTWTGRRAPGTTEPRGRIWQHEVSAAGPGAILGSADPAFGGDRLRWNPEQLLVSALAQCHMMWYLGLCHNAAVVVTAYVDEAVGTLTASGHGGQFTEVVLHPQVTVAAEDMVEAAAALHADAHRACFIANSVNFPVRHEPRIAVADERVGQLFL